MFRQASSRVDNSACMTACPRHGMHGIRKQPKPTSENPASATSRRRAEPPKAIPPLPNIRHFEIQSKRLHQDGGIRFAGYTLRNTHCTLRFFRTHLRSFYRSFMKEQRIFSGWIEFNIFYWNFTDKGAAGDHCSCCACSIQIAHDFRISAEMKNMITLGVAVNFFPKRTIHDPEIEIAVQRKYVAGNIE